MGNLDLDNFCNCENNDSKFETSFKTNQTGDKMLCPFVNTIIYQNFNIENGQKNKNTPKLKNKELNFSKNKSKFDPNDCEMNFEYHTTKPNKLKDSTKLKMPNKSFFNLNPDTNYDKNLFSDKNINNINNNEEGENKNKIITLENDNYIEDNNNINIERNQKEMEEEKINENKNNNYKINEISSNNSVNSNIKTNIDKPKQTPKNGLDYQIWSKNVYYIGYYNDGVAEGIGKLITGNSKYFGEFKDDQANGYGIFYKNNNETIYEGLWLNDAQNEYGIEKWSDDSILGDVNNEYDNGAHLIFFGADFLYVNVAETIGNISVRLVKDV